MAVVLLKRVAVPVSVGKGFFLFFTSHHGV